MLSFEISPRFAAELFGRAGWRYQSLMLLVPDNLEKAGSLA